MAATSALMVLMLLAVQQCCVSGQNSTDDRLALMDTLLDNYPARGPYVLPSSPVTVKLGLTLVSITKLNHAQKIASMSVWLKMTWNDPRLKWNPQDHGGITSLRVPMKSIWKPDITLYQKIDHELLVDENILAVVSSDGAMLWIPPTTVSVVCPGDDANTWNCVLDFGSWVYDGYNLDLGLYDDTEQIDVSHLPKSEDIEITKNTASKVMKYYKCCPEPYPKLSFVLSFDSKGALAAGATGHFTLGQLTLSLFIAIFALFRF